MGEEVGLREQSVPLIRADRRRPVMGKGSSHGYGYPRSGDRPAHSERPFGPRRGCKTNTGRHRLYRRAVKPVEAMNVEVKNSEAKRDKPHEDDAMTTMLDEEHARSVR